MKDINLKIFVFQIRKTSLDRWREFSLPHDFN